MAILAKDQATIVALDRSTPKVERISTLARLMGLKSIHAYVMDATKCFSEDETDVRTGDFSLLYASIHTRETPKKLPKNVFDKILLDGPCSALGKCEFLATIDSVCAIRWWQQVI